MPALSKIIDDAIGLVAPTWAARRTYARLAREATLRYAGADRGRKNKDWQARKSSADAEIIGSFDTLNSRARQMLRDSDVARAIQLAKVRNIVGRGITPIPTATDAGGVEMAALNKEVERRFWRWANDRKAVDCEGRRNFWAFQRLQIAEKVAVGEAFTVLVYTAEGLKLQAYEAEQLDETKQNHNGNEVRRGIEIDRDGRPVAYHFYIRNPNDYLFRKTLEPVRIEAERVLHFMDPERVRQTHGVTELAAVLQRMRDADRRDNAEMMAAIMEACIGAVIESPNHYTGLAGAGGVNPASGDTGTTAGGIDTFDMVPGMVARLQPGEQVKFLAPTRPGGSFEPFARHNLRRIAAGSDLSYEQVNRDFSQGTYSSQRQSLLEDQRAWRPQQDLLTDLFVAPVYEAWYRFEVLNGRLPVSPVELSKDPARYLEAEYVPDGHDWIDPEAEVSAYEKALGLRLITRKEIVSKRGGRFAKVFEQIAAERKAAAAAGITLPEDQPKQGAAVAPTQATQKPEPKQSNDAGPGAAPVANPDVSLNGAQITAAIDVLAKLRAGEIGADVAVSLLISLSIDQAVARRMVNESKSLPPPPASSQPAQP